MIEDWKAMYRALVRRLVEIADNPSATERMVAYDLVARTHEQVVVEITSIFDQEDTDE